MLDSSNGITNGASLFVFLNLFNRSEIDDGFFIFKSLKFLFIGLALAEEKLLPTDCIFSDLFCIFQIYQ